MAGEAGSCSRAAGPSARSRPSAARPATESKPAIGLLAKSVLAMRRSARIGAAARW